MRPSHLLGILSFILPTLSRAEPDAQPDPNAAPDANANPEAEAEAQQYTNNAPFSGAIYIVNPNGQGVTTQSSNVCPSYASVSCSNINQPSWCCPSGYSCASPANSNGLIGCCPSGSNCGGTVNVASVTTVTVYASQQTTTVMNQPTQATVVVYNQPTTHAAAGGFCSTLTMNGPNLPTVTQGACGTILIVNEGSLSLKTIGYGFSSILFLFHLALARMLHWT